MGGSDDAQRPGRRVNAPLSVCPLACLSVPASSHPYPGALPRCAPLRLARKRAPECRQGCSRCSRPSSPSPSAPCRRRLVAWPALLRRLLALLARLARLAWSLRRSQAAAEWSLPSRHRPPLYWPSARIWTRERQKRLETLRSRAHGTPSPDRPRTLRLDAEDPGSLSRALQRTIFRLPRLKRQARSSAAWAQARQGDPAQSDSDGARGA
eukprot:scaffold1681_cov237-Pinguiococcus_pyrenoidosus.AAC.5